MDGLEKLNLKTIKKTGTTISLNGLQQKVQYLDLLGTISINFQTLEIG